MSRRARRIEQEVALLQSAGFRVKWDRSRGDWVHIGDVPFPPGLGRSKGELLLLIPNDYPNTPPNGLFVEQDIRLPNHYFQYQGVHNPLGDKGWGWYCFHVEPGGVGWRPSATVRSGDNLFQFLKLANGLMRYAVSHG